MAYRNLLNRSLGSTAAVQRAAAFKAIRDFLTSTGDYAGQGPGWTLISSYYVVSSSVISDGDWIRISTNGERGDDYFEVTIRLGGSGITVCTGFGFTGTGTSVPNYSRVVVSNVTSSLQQPQVNLQWPTWSRLYIYASLDFVTIIVTDGVLAGPTRFGVAEWVFPATTREVDTITTAVTAGAGKTLTMTNSSNRPYWVVGAKIQIFDHLYAECSVIQDVNTSLKTIGVDNLTNPYTSGARVCTLFPYYCDGANKNTSAAQSLTISTSATGTVVNQCYIGWVSLQNSNAHLETTINPIHNKWAATPLLLVNSVAATSGFALRVPNCFTIRKQPVEGQMFTDGVNNYRYFGLTSAETSYGVLYKEV